MSSPTSKTPSPAQKPIASFFTTADSTANQSQGVSPVVIARSSSVSTVVTGTETTTVAGNINTDNMHPNANVAAQDQATGNFLSRFIKSVKDFFRTPDSEKGVPTTSFWEKVKHAFTFWKKPPDTAPETSTTTSVAATTVVTESAEDAATRKQTNMNTFVTFLSKEKSIKEEGIFRISGGSDGVGQILTKVKDSSNELVLDGFTRDEAGSAFKKFTKSIGIFDTPQGNFLWELSKKPQEDQAARKKELEDFIKTLPEDKKKLLGTLVTFLKNVESHKDTNKMTAENIAISFIGPSLIEVNQADFAKSVAEGKTQEEQKIPAALLLFELDPAVFETTLT